VWWAGPAIGLGAWEAMAAPKCNINIQYIYIYRERERDATWDVKDSVGKKSIFWQGNMKELHLMLYNSESTLPKLRV
jgi:hypothetical protein